MLLSIACPHCKSTEVRRAQRRLWERLFMVSRAYRCDFCSRRFVKMRA